MLNYVPSDPPWLKERTIVLHKAGSHAYGMATSESDLDIRGICIAPLIYHLGVSKTFEQRVASEPVDLVIYEVKKFIKLASDANPNILETLWVDEGDILLSSDPYMRLRARRDLFLSQRVKHTYSGYAISQLKRIKAHKRWLLNPVEVCPTREQFGLQERKVLQTDDLGAAMAEVKKLVDSWELDLSDLDDARRVYPQEKMAETIAARTSISAETAAASILGMDSNLMEYIDRERRFKAAKADYDQYQTWKKSRNPKRAALEAKYGYDCKHASHLYRLLKTCREILETGVLHVKRPDAEDILAIRNGAWSYDALVAWAENEDKVLYDVMKKSSLPKTPNYEAIDALCMEVLRDAG